MRRCSIRGGSMEVGGLRSADYSAKRGAEAEEDIRKGSYGETRGKA